MCERIKSQLFLSIFVLFTLSCENAGTDNIRIVRIFNKIYPPDKDRFTGALINNEREGLWIKYDSLGNIESESTYVHGKQWGESRIFEGGYLAGKAQDTIINNDTISTLYEYNSKGKTVTSGQYVNGVKNGIWKYYRGDGDIIIKTENYIKGKLYHGEKK